MAICEVCGRPVGGNCFHEVNENFWEEYVICESCMNTNKANKRSIQLMDWEDKNKYTVRKSHKWFNKAYI
jgi:protein-arginine kinase activator protein McsA